MDDSTEGVITAPEDIKLNVENPDETVQQLKEAAAQLTPEQIEANRQRLLRTMRSDRRAFRPKMQWINGVKYGLPGVQVLVVATPWSLRVELHGATKEEYDFFKSIFQPTNPLAKIEIRKREVRQPAPVVRAWLRKQAESTGIS